MEQLNTFARDKVTLPKRGWHRFNTLTLLAHLCGRHFTTLAEGNICEASILLCGARPTIGLGASALCSFLTSHRGAIFAASLTNKLVESAWLDYHCANGTTSLRLCRNIIRRKPHHLHEVQHSPSWEGTLLHLPKATFAKQHHLHIVQQSLPEGVFMLHIGISF